MADNKEEISKQLQPQSIQRIRSARHNSLYTNSAQVGMTFFDFKFIFSEVVDVTGEILILEDLATVNMSPQHAKTFLNLLAGKVTQYENLFGEIKIPDEAVNTRQFEAHSKPT